MFNAFDPNGAREQRAPERGERGAEQPIADREVPIGFSVTPQGVHEWLDGEVEESAIRRSETTRHIEFWNRLNAEAETRRQMKTPAHVQAQIMAAIAPQRARQVATPWFSRPITITPMTAAAAAAGLVAVGAMLAWAARLF